MIGAKLIHRMSRRFRADERGAVLAETLVIVPFVTLFSVGILEFGNMFWQKQQIEVGLRDAARYLARCQRNTTFVESCNEATAVEIAFYGTANAVAGTTPLRVPGWGPPTATIEVFPPLGTVSDVIVVSTDYSYVASPLFGWLDLDAITIEAYHEQRYIGW